MPTSAASAAAASADVDALLMLFELLMAVFMEKHTPKSPANSGLPPSQSPNDATARTRPGAKGKGPSYNEARCANTRTREYVKVLSVDACARCGEDLTDTACTRKYAEAYCRISSYLQSMANQGYNPLVAIQIALAGRAVDNLPE